MTEQERRDREFTAAVRRTTADAVRKLRKEIQFLEFSVLTESAISADGKGFSGHTESPRYSRAESSSFQRQQPCKKPAATL